MPTEHHQVVIVGAGLAGLTAAAFLARRGIRPLVVERHPSTSVQPKARVQNPRTMELLRLLGLEEGVRRTTVPGVRRRRIIAETLLGGTIDAQGVARRMPDWSRYTAASWGLASQERVECMLNAHALAAGVDVRFTTEVTAVEDHPDGGVLLGLRDSRSGFPGQVLADWVVAADGHQSPVRRLRGIAGTGRGKLAEYVRVVFSADLRALLGTDEVLYFLRHPTRGPGTVHSTDLPNRYVVSMEVPDGPGARDGWSREQLRELVRDVVGLPTLAVEICEVTCWDMTDDTALSFRDGRVVLAGDAAHLIPPVGGFGGNTAVQDGAELAWRLADVVQGVAGEAVLDDYAAERHAFARYISGQAVALYTRRLNPTAASAEDPAELPYQHSVFGFRYPTGGFVPAPGDGAPAAGAVDPAALDGTPGSRAPHVVFAGPDGPVSTHDLLGYRYTLLAGRDGAAWRSALEKAAGQAGLDGARALVVGDDLGDPDDVFEAAFGITAGGAVLVRPDGCVAFRAVDAEPDPYHRLARTLERLLRRTGVRAAAGEPARAVTTA